MNTNQLYYGDNLDILRTHIPDESVDLIYIDPPFNSNQAYNVIFSETDGSSSQAQIQAFEDTWRWGETTEQAYHELVVTAPHLLVETIKSFRGFLTETNLMVYLVMMALRLVELHRALKPTGSFYLHCDPTASHYLKIILDQIFGVQNFRNEIVWCYKRWPSKQTNFQKMHDVILRYGKSEDVIWNQLYDDFTEQTKKRIKGGKKIEHYVGESGKVLIRATNEVSPGVAMCDYWNIPMIAGQAKERLGYPTQKPEALLERIIKASSNEGDVVLDTFCGCGTAVAVAQRLNRRWIGVDITHLAIALLKYRLADSFGDDVTYEIIGEPKDTASAKALAAQDRYQFQWWALSLIRARPYQDKKKGADEGVDGVIYYQDVDPDNPKKTLTRKIVVQVKSGKVSVRDIRELKSVVETQDAVIGVFITLNLPTQPMVKEAAAAGRFQWLHVAHTTYPKIQIRTIEELLSGQGIEYPQTPVNVTFRRTERATPQNPQLEIEVNQ
jgi:site-specific DNA-methyltransferase (adenine-specific)